MQELHKEKGLGLEKTKERRRTEGERKGHRVEIRLSHEAGEAVSKALSLRGVKDYTVEVYISDLLRTVAVKLERKDQGVFGRCRLFTDPPSISALGLKFEVLPGVIDVTAKEYYETQAAAGTSAALDDSVLRRYVVCALDYARILGTTALKLEGYVHAVGPDWLGFSDLLRYTQTTVENALAHDSLEPGIEEMISVARETFFTPCRFKGNIYTFNCGGIFVFMRPVFSVKLGETELFGSTFCGISGTFRVSSVWSLDRAWEKFLREVGGKSELDELARYVENLEAQGEIRRASMLKKKILSQAERGRINIDLSALP